MDIRKLTGVWELLHHLFKNAWIVNKMHKSQKIQIYARMHARTHTHTHEKSRKARIHLNLLKQCDNNVCHLFFHSKTPHFAHTHKILTVLKTSIDYFPEEH